jgi:hypothetical protein
MAVGVANPRAQGQATTVTVTICIRADVKSARTIYHPINVNTASARIVGTNTEESLSAKR